MKLNLQNVLSMTLLFSAASTIMSLVIRLFSVGLADVNMFINHIVAIVFNYIGIMFAGLAAAAYIMMVIRRKE